MTDDPTMPLPKPPSEDPGETLRPVRPAVPGGETEAIAADADAGGAGDAAEHAALKVSSRRIKVRKLGPYELLGMLGRGGMGAVYEAFDTRLNRRVALKVMLASDEATTEERERFHREAAHSAKLRHPNIVPVHDVGHEEGRDYLVMDLVEGVTLGEALRQRQFTYREKAALLEKVARAVQYAHAQGVIHRDLKPGNIMLDYGRGSSTLHGGGSKPLSQAPTEAPLSKAETMPQPAKPVDISERSASSSLVPDLSKVAPAFFEPLVMDFGLAKDTQQESGLSRTGQALGTPAYMAPEQAEGKAKLVGPRSDVYSLGAVLYEMLAERPPFVGENALQVMRAALHEEPVPPRVFTPGVPRDLETICLKCLEKEPGRRYASAAEFADDLKAFQHDEPISARPVGAAERVWKRVRKSPAPYVVGAVALSLIIVGTAGFMWSLNQKRREAETALAKFITEKEAKEKAERERSVLEKEKSREWQLVFEDDFSDPEKSKQNWQIITVGGKWEIKNGELHVWGREQDVAILRNPVAGDVRLEFECHQDGNLLSDVSCFLCASTTAIGAGTYRTGYLCQYGGRTNTCNALLRKRYPVWQEEAAPLLKGETYRVRAERIGDRLKYCVNGTVVFDIRDAQPLSSREQSLVGLLGWEADTYWDNVKLYQLGEPLSADLLAAGLRHLERGHAATARDIFQDVLASSNEPERQARAKDGLVKAEARLTLEEKLPQWQAELQQAWPKARLWAANGELAVDISHNDVTDLTRLRGLPIVELCCTNNKIPSLDPLRGMPLTCLLCGNNFITTLEPLHGMSLTLLSCHGNKLRDLEPLRGMPLRTLSCSGNKVGDLNALQGMRLVDLSCTGCGLESLAPLQGMPLSLLDCSENKIADLEPLRGMPLRQLSLSGCSLVRDLSPLQGTKVFHLELADCDQIRDFSPLKGLPLRVLNLAGTAITDLSSLKGMVLKELAISRTAVTDLSSLAGMELRKLSLSPARITRGMDVVRGMKTLSSIATEKNWEKPYTAEEFWRRYDAGEFK